MMLVEKIKFQWGYNVGSDPPDVVLSMSDGVLSVAHWPTANPPTIAEIEAVVLPTPVTLRHVAPYDFQDRFTDAELVAIQTSLDPLLIRGRTKLQTIITYVDLDAVETQQLVGYMGMLGILTAERVAEILS